MKKNRIYLLVLASVVILCLYFNQRFKMARSVPARDNWAKENIKVSKEDITYLPTMEKLIIDEYKNDIFYVYPSIPDYENYDFDKIINFTKKELIQVQTVQDFSDTTTPIDFNGYSTQNINTYNRVDTGNELLINTDKNLYLVDKKDLNYKIIKTFDDAKDYQRRFKFLYYDDKYIYYMYNGKKDDGNFEISPNANIKTSAILYKENINTNEVSMVDLSHLDFVTYSDFIHLENVSMDNFLLNIINDTMYFYDIKTGQNLAEISIDNYYFNPFQVLSTDNYYIERGIFGRYGVGIFNKSNSKLVNVIVDNSRYGSIHNMKIFDDRYLLLEPSFNSNANMDSFKIVDLNEEKTYYYNIKKAIKSLSKNKKFEYRVFAIEDGYAYIQTISEKKEHFDYKVYKLKLNLDIN